MRTNLTLDDKLFDAALALADPGTERSELIEICIKSFIQLQKARRLGVLGDQMPEIALAPRRAPDGLTLSLDPHVAERASEAAHGMGKSLSQAVLDYVEHLASVAQAETLGTAFEARAQASPGLLGGWKFDREEANKRR